MAKFSSFKGNQTYGGHKYLLEYKFGASNREKYINFEEMLNGAVPKMISYTIEHMTYAIRAVEEKQVTKLVVVTPNCPWYTLFFRPEHIFFPVSFSTNSEFFRISNCYRRSRIGYYRQKMKERRFLQILATRLFCILLIKQEVENQIRLTLWIFMKNGITR